MFIIVREGRNMSKKNKVIGNILATIIIILATFTPIVYAEDLNCEKKVIITTTKYQFFDKKEIITEVSEEEAEDIMDDLENLRQALIEGNNQLIEKYESSLINKGIFDEKNKIFSKKNTMNVLYERYLSTRLNNPSSLADENILCFVNARGKGNLSFMFDSAFEIFMTAAVLLLVLCAFFPPLIAIFGLPILLLIFVGIFGLTTTHLIPFRVLYPTLKMRLNSGDCSITGLRGSQQYTAPLEAVFSGFNGLTVNFQKWSSVDNNVFLLGFALKSVV